MSKEAMGNHGQVIGSSSYFAQINRTTFWGSLPNAGSPDYIRVLREIASRADSAISTVYNDLQYKKSAISAIPESDRNKLAKQVRAFYDICAMGGGYGSRCSECVSLLSASSSSLRFSFFTQNELTEAAKKLKNNWTFSESEAAALIEKAANWGIDWASDGNEKKKAFLTDVESGKGKSFLQEVLDTYRRSCSASDFRGRNGYSIGSNSYVESLEKDVFCCSISSSYGAGWGNPQYAKLLKEALNSISDKIRSDLEDSLRSNCYMTDANAENTREALQNLERCGVSTFSCRGLVDKLAWYVGGNAYKIQQLQQKLNETGVAGHLTEDGVFGTKTLNAWVAFLNKLEHGTVPTLAWTDLLQSQITKITIGATTAGKNAGINNALVYRGTDRYIRIDGPHNKYGYFRGVNKQTNYNHVNFDAMADSNAIYDWLQKQYNHYPLSDEAYHALSNLDDTAKAVRIGGKVLAVCGVALDALELGMAVTADLNDADRKLGKTTVSSAASIGGRWGGAALGAKLGALAGTLAGPAAPIAIPILSLVGGIAGSFAGDALASWVVDITYVGE